MLLIVPGNRQVGSHSGARMNFMCCACVERYHPPPFSVSGSWCAPGIPLVQILAGTCTRGQLDVLFFNNTLSAAVPGLRLGTACPRCNSGGPVARRWVAAHKNRGALKAQQTFGGGSIFPLNMMLSFLSGLTLCP